MNKLTTDTGTTGQVPSLHPSIFTLTYESQSEISSDSDVFLLVRGRYRRQCCVKLGGRSGHRRVALQHRWRWLMLFCSRTEQTSALKPKLIPRKEVRPSVLSCTCLSELSAAYLSQKTGSFLFISQISLGSLNLFERREMRRAEESFTEFLMCR